MGYFGKPTSFSFGQSIRHSANIRMPEEAPAPNSLPGIAIVTPNRNYGQTLGHTVRSVLDQHYPILDYIVVDDGSTDDSRPILESIHHPSFRWKARPNGDQYSAINEGFASTHGEIMGWINSDDVMMPWTLATVAGIFAQFPEVDWIMGVPAVIQSGAVQQVATVRPYPRDALRLALHTGGNRWLVQQESCFWRRRLWEKAGPLRPEFGLAADFELWMRFAAECELVCCSALLGAFTVHGANRSRIHRSQYEADMNRAVSTLSSADRALRDSWARRHDRYLRWRGFPGLKGLTRRLSGLDQVRAPVLHRDIDRSAYVLRTDPVYP